MFTDDEGAFQRDDDAFAASQERQAKREAADPFYLARCEDCGGTGIDVGSLGEPEDCKMCLGRGYELEPEIARMEPRPGFFPQQLARTRRIA